jgi:phosphoribosyl-AMP cyclohydrolase
MSYDLEESCSLSLDFNKLNSLSGQDVVPVVVQHAETKDVLILAYVNEEALRLSQEKGQAVFWSTSRKELWVKGSESGDSLRLVDILVNCEQNSLLFLVIPDASGVCHTKKENGETRSTCYYRRLDAAEFLFKLNK